MRNVWRLQAEWLIFLSLSSAVVVVQTASNVVGSPRSESLSQLRSSKPTGLINHSELLSESEKKENANQFASSNEEPTTNSVLNELCRSHGDLLDPLHFLVVKNQVKRDIQSTNIRLVHETFDSSFGLVPFITYEVRIPKLPEVIENVYAVQVNLGKVMIFPETSIILCNAVDGNSQLQLLPESLTNVSWTIRTVPDAPRNLTIRVLNFSTKTRESKVLFSDNYTILPGCYLKLLSSHSMVSSSQIPPQFDSVKGQDRLTWKSSFCTFVLQVPVGSSAEITLRKLKLFRANSRDCHKDSQLQLAGSSTWDPYQSKNSNNSGEWKRMAFWFTEIDSHQWSIARTYCGKIQDYAKNLRTWRTAYHWVLVRFRTSLRTRHHLSQVNNHFFAFKVNVFGPCSNLLLTELSKTIELSRAELLANTECNFRIHVLYGHRIHLSVQLLFDEMLDPSYQENLKDWIIKEEKKDVDLENNILLLHSGKCQVAVRAEDTIGHQTKCLHPGLQTALFSSTGNVLKFQAMLLQAFKEDDKTESLQLNYTSKGSTPKTVYSLVRLRVSYFSEADQRLTSGCGEGLLADEVTCIWLNHEPLSWHEAEAKCNQLATNGHLVAITNAGIQQAVDAIIVNSAHYEPTDSHWIGGSDQKQETIYEWSSGQTFNYAKWFSGWPTHGFYNAQPSDDGISNQDCIEIRQSFGQPGQSEALASGFFWNDRDCSVPNPFVCQKPRNDGALKSDQTGVFQDLLTCNRTESLDRSRSSTVIRSPFFPRPYPNSAICTVVLGAPVGFNIVLNFDFFDLEEEEDCNYDAVDLQSLNLISIPDEQKDPSSESSSWRRCGNWNSRLKLLRWKSVNNIAQIKFTSDSSYSGNGFQLVATIERGDFYCPDTNSFYHHHGRCYLIAPYPEIEWNQAHQMCKSIQSELVLPDSSSEEVLFLMDQINSNEQLNSTAFYWIGQTSRFQLSIPHSVDAIQQCPSMRTWSPLSNTTLNLEPCSSKGGYICEKLLKSNHGLARNSSIESREGEVKSPNHPSPYGEGNHFRLHIRAPNSSSHSERLMVRFKQIDIEFQENCLYDYIGLQSKENGPMHKICGQYTTNLDQLDFVSDTAEVWLTFHSDLSVSGDGFHAVWSTIPLLGCPEHSVLEEPANGQLYSPYYPNYYLPNLNCTYHLVAPVGQRIWIKFYTFEIGLHDGSQKLVCRDEYVRLHWGPSHSIVLCGSYNLSREHLQWMSDGNRLSVQLLSVNGKQGRGFHASYRFVPVPTLMRDELFLDTEDELELIPFNYPHPPPSRLRHQITLLTRHGSYIRHQAASWLTVCHHSSGQQTSPPSIMVILSDTYNNRTEIQLCYYGDERDTANQTEPAVYESLFHSMTIEFVTINAANWSSFYGRVRAVADDRYAEKVSAFPENSPVESCANNPCKNQGVCTTLHNKSFCQCHGNWRGLFCSLTLCQLPSSYCRHGSCSIINETERCNCDPGFTGLLCDSRLSPCDLDPCGDRGKCVPSADSFICQCHPWWQGPRCESRWLHLPYKPLSQRMLEEPFWLGLMTIAIVLVVIAIVWCAKRHFAEKFERFVSEELERGKLVEPAMLDWSRGRFSHRLSMEANTIASRPVSPSTGLNVPIPEAASSSQRHLLGWAGFRKPSLLSITSLISPSHSHTNVAGPVNSGGSGTRRSASGNRAQRGCRTFSLDDLFRLPKRSPSPNKRGSDNDVATQRRELERQQILQRLIASQVPSNRQGCRPRETLMMTQLGVNYVSNASQDQITETDLQETAIAAQIQLQLDLKAEKKVTFARMMEMVKAEMSSSETETSAGEEHIKSREVAVAALPLDHRSVPSKRKQRNWNSRRFWRSNNSNSSTQGSASDQDIQDISSEQIQTSINLAISNSNSQSSVRKGNRHLRLPSRTSSGGRQASSTESLLNIIRSFSTTNHRTPSTPSSPQISDYEVSSSFPTPLSTPGSPAGSLEIIPSASSCNSTVDCNSIQVTVVDQSVSHRNSRGNTTSLATPHITLEIPTVNYGQFLSPIHEVPTPLPSPAHTPTPSLKRTDRVGTDSGSSLLPNNSTRLERKRSQLQQQRRTNESIPDVIYRSDSSAPSILVEAVDDIPLESTVERPSISIVVPSPIQIRIESESPPPSTLSSASNSPLPSPARSKPPPLNIINSNFARFDALVTSLDHNQPEQAVSVPLVCVSEASPDRELNFEESSGALNRATWQLQQQQRQRILDWGQVTLGSPPLRRLPVDHVDIHRVDVDSVVNDTSVRRALNKETLDKSNSLDLTHPPPMITITASFSEVESDSDAGMLGRGGMGNQKMSYLSPFTCYGSGRHEIATSESNLSSSGYSSMASPGPSPSCSSKTLCILEEDLNLHRMNIRRRERRVLHRSILSPSLESSSPPADSPPGRALPSLSLFFNNSSMGRPVLPSDSEMTDDPMAESAEPVESTCDNESHDEGIDTFPVMEKSTNGNNASLERADQITDSRHPTNLTRVYKSTSLDSKLIGQRRTNLKGDSLDTKLLSLQTSGTMPIVLQSLQLPETTTNWCQSSCDGPSNTDDSKLRSSPVSSRSESPLSDAKSAGLGRFSTHFYGMSRSDIPYTDSDGLYDYPSSETILPANNLSRRHARKCDRRRERKTSLMNNRSLDQHRESNEGSPAIRSFLDPGVDRGVGRLSSAKRRVRAQTNIDFCASSSSNESISSLSKPSRSKKSPRSHILNYRRGSSPVCDVILTIQVASSVEESPSEMGEEKNENDGSNILDTSTEPKAFRLPSRTRAGQQQPLRLSERRRSETRKRELLSARTGSRGSSRKSCPTPDEANRAQERSSSSSYDTETGNEDSNESLANLGEIEDSVDSPNEDYQSQKTVV